MATKKGSRGSQIKRVLVLPDVQCYWDDGVAGVDLKTWKAVLEYAKDFTWDECVIVGDFLDFNCISSHNEKKPRLNEAQRISLDYEVGNQLLDELQAALGKKTKVVLIEGNHEYRMQRFVDACPQLEGSLEVEVGLNLETRGVKYVKFWSDGSVYKIGKACFIHGRHTNEFHAKKHVIEYGTNVFYGHTHDVQSYAQVLKGDNKTIVGQSLGCLCVYNLPYMQGRPSKWQQAFAVFHFFPDGYFNYTITRIFNHRFVSPEGKLYPNVQK